MWRYISQFILFFFFIFLLALLNITLSYLLPYPLSAANLPFVVFCFYIIFRENGTIVWFSFFSYFMIELFVDVPFGVLLFSATFACFFAFWLYQNVITNRQWFAALLLLGSSLLVFRSLYILFIFVLSWFGIVDLSWSRVLVQIFWEFVLTMALFLLLYPLVGIVFRSKSYSQ